MNLPGQKEAVMNKKKQTFKYPGKRVAVTCHGGVINVWAAHVVGFDPRLFFNPNYTSVNRFMAASSGSKTVITLNEHFHLK